MEEEKKVDKKSGTCIVSGRNKVDCTCFNCFRNWHLSQRKNLSSSQPCMKREDYESCKPQFNSQTVTLCNSCDSDSDEPSQKKSKLSDSKGKYHRKLSTTKLPATKFAVDILGSGEVIPKSTMQSVSDLSKNKNQIKCSDNVIDISDESSTSSVSCDSDITLPDIMSPMSEDTDEKEETTPIDCVPGRIGEDANPEIIDITENIEDSEVLFNYSQEDAVILISDDDDDDDGDGEYDDNDDDDEFDRRIKRMDIESSKKPCHQNNIGFVNANVQFSEEESKFFSREIKKEIPDSMADYGIDVSTKHKVKKEEEEEEAEEHSRQSENSKVNSLIFDVPVVKLEPSSNDKGSEEALQNVENTQLFHQLLIKQEKPDSQDSVILFKECEESPKLNSIVAKDKPTSIEKKDPLSDKSMKSPIFPSKLGLSSNRFSSSTSDDDDDDDDADCDNTQCYSLKPPTVLPMVTKTVSQWLTKQNEHGQSLVNHSVSNDVDFDDDDDDDDDDDADNNDDDDDDELYMCATQVEENLLKEGQLNEKAKKEGPQISRFYKSLQKPPKSSTTPESPKYSSKKAENLRGSSTKTSNDSLTPDVAKKIFGSANTSTASLSMVKQKSKGKLQKHCWKITDEDSDSDSSMYSMATQVDHNVSLINDIDVDNDDDESYIQNTQVDSVPRKTSFKFKSKLVNSLTKSKRLQDTSDNDSDSDDSQFSIATQVDCNTVPKSGHQIKNNSSLFPKVSTSLTNNQQIPRTEMSEFKTPKFPHRKKKSKCISSDRAAKNIHSGSKRGIKSTRESDEESEKYFMPTSKKGSNNKTMTPKSVHHSNISNKDVDEDYDSDSSMFSMATQLDDPLCCQNDEERDDPYFQATQVDKPQSNFNTSTNFPLPKANSFKIPLHPPKRLSKPSKYKLDIRHCKERNEDYDSDDSLFSVATQVDDLCPLKINNEEKEEFYMKETQVDESFTSKTSKKQHCFLPPVHLKAKVSKKNSTSKPKATNDDDDDDGDDSLFLATTQVDSIDSSKDAIQPADSSFSDFVLAIAATEPSSIGTVSSNATPQQMQCVEKEEHPPDSNFADFLLKLSKDTDEDESVFTKPLPNVKVSEIEPQRLKSKKEIRENFKLQRRKIDNKSKVSSKSPEKSPTKLFEPTKLSIEDSIPPKKKKPSLKNSKISTERVISEGISSAKCQLVERSFFKSLDKTPVKWDKTSSVRVGSSSSLSSDVTLPNADEIKKLGLPLIETPKRRRPLPETLIKNHPEESQDLTRALSPVLDTVSSDGSTQKKPPPPPPPPTLPTPPSPPLPLLLPLSPTFTNNQKTNYNSSSSNKTSLTKHPPPSLTPLPLFENINKCFAKDFNSFHIPKIKNSSLKPKSDSTQTTNITPLPYKYNNSILKQTISSDVPKCTPSYPKSSLSQIHLNTRHPTSTTNTSKRVTFAAGNKSIEVSQQPHWQRSTQQQTQTDLLKYLLRWNTKWLQEQNTLQTAPPVVSKDQLFPLLQSYSSYTDYVNVIRPLLLLEVWESVYREYMESISTARILQVACNNVRKASSSYVDYIIYGVVSEMDQFAHNCISDGDFVILKLQVKNSTSQSGISDGNYGHSRINSEYPVFGFVDKITFHRPQCYDEILDNFPDLAILSRTIPNFKIFRAIIKCHYRKLTYCFSKLLKVQLVASLIPFLRQYQALVKFTSNPLHSHILNPSDGSAIITDSAIPVNGHYNTSQKKAISAAAEMACLPISKPYYCLVQGPPGTGKSHTIIGMIQKIKEQKPQSKILLCAPSNGAVDELMRRLIEDRQKAQAESRVPLKFVRIGNPKYIHKDVVEYSLKKLILRNCKPNGVKQSSMLAEKKQYCNELKLNEEEICKISEQPKSSLRDERIRKLRKDQRYVKDKVDLLKKQLENNQAAMSNIEPSPAEEASLERSLLSNADVICGTLSTCGNNRFITRLAEEQFSCIIIDEASQCCELDSLIPLQYKCCKLVLIGDTEQLSPTIISQLASEYNYGQSLFERLCKHYKYKEKNSVILLNVQYRMHPDICKFPNRYIYNNQLISDSVLEARSSNIPVVPYLLFDAQFGSHVRSSDSGSLSNPLEANFTVCLCECLSNVRLVRASLKIAVIAPYKEQKKLLECLLNKRRLFNVDVTTVDGFQGRENDIIIMSCVRAHSSFGNIGFLKNRRRLNVALTRAKFALYIVGHLASLEGDEDWKSLIQDAQDRHLVLRVGYEDQFQSVVKKCIKV